jgi:hypothetical protein
MLFWLCSSVVEQFPSMPKTSRFAPEYHTHTHTHEYVSIFPQDYFESLFLEMIVDSTMISNEYEICIGLTVLELIFMKDSLWI